MRRFVRQSVAAMKPSQDLEVSSNVADALMASVLRPVLSELAQEAQQPIAVKVLLSFQGESAARSLNVDAGEGKSIASGEIRVLVKTGQEGFRFDAEAILNDLAPGTGFSGFSLKGKLKLNEGKPASKLTGRSYRYNVWEWSRAFRLE
jgi:hypothetical protein